MKRGHQAVVTAQLEGMAVSATTLVEVGAPSVKSIAIDQTGAELTVSAGDDLQLTATAVLSDDLLDLVDDGEEEADEHHDFTSRLQWESLDTNVAVADPEEPGKFHAVAAGQVTIMATLPGSDFSMQVSIIVID
jgi:hypothetical protein